MLLASSSDFRDNRGDQNGSHGANVTGSAAKDSKPFVASYEKFAGIDVPDSARRDAVTPGTALSDSFHSAIALSTSPTGAACAPGGPSAPLITGNLKHAGSYYSTYVEKDDPFKAKSCTQAFVEKFVRVSSYTAVSRNFFGAFLFFYLTCQLDSKVEVPALPELLSIVGAFVASVAPWSVIKDSAGRRVKKIFKITPPKLIISDPFYPAVPKTCQNHASSFMKGLQGALTASSMFEMFVHGWNRFSNGVGMKDHQVFGIELFEIFNWPALGILGAGVFISQWLNYTQQADDFYALFTNFWGKTYSLPPHQQSEVRLLLAEIQYINMYETFVGKLEAVLREARPSAVDHFTINRAHVAQLLGIALLVAREPLIKKFDYQTLLQYLSNLRSTDSIGIRELVNPFKILFGQPTNRPNNASFKQDAIDWFKEHESNITDVLALAQQLDREKCLSISESQEYLRHRDDYKNFLNNLQSIAGEEAHLIDSVQDELKRFRAIAFPTQVSPVAPSSPLQVGAGVVGVHAEGKADADVLPDATVAVPVAVGYISSARRDADLRPWQPLLPALLAVAGLSLRSNFSFALKFFNSFGVDSPIAANGYAGMAVAALFAMNIVLPVRMLKALWGDRVLMNIHQQEVQNKNALCEISMAFFKAMISGIPAMYFMWFVTQGQSDQALYMSAALLVQVFTKAAPDAIKAKDKVDARQHRPQTPQHYLLDAMLSDYVSKYEQAIDLREKCKNIYGITLPASLALDSPLNKKQLAFANEDQAMEVLCEHVKALNEFIVQALVRENSAYNKVGFCTYFGNRVCHEIKVTLPWAFTICGKGGSSTGSAPDTTVQPASP